MRTTHATLLGSALATALAAAFLGASFLGVLSCGGGATSAPMEEPTGSNKVVMADPNKWPANDHSMCDWKNKPDLEVDETEGPGALKPNVRRVYKTFGEGETRHRSIVCREIDTNLDGIKDVVRTFNAKGEAIHEEADRNYDGKLDVWVSFVDGRMSEEDIDSNFDGKVDVWKFYVDGELTRVKRDTNGDGKPDVWEIYTHGKLDRMGVDTEFDGHVDRWDRDMVAQRAADDAEMKTRALMNKSTDAGSPNTVHGGPADGVGFVDAGAVRKPTKAARSKK